jgi:hypothetical protein
MAHQEVRDPIERARPSEWNTVQVKTKPCERLWIFDSPSFREHRFELAVQGVGLIPADLAWVTNVTDDRNEPVEEDIGRDLLSVEPRGRRAE